MESLLHLMMIKTIVVNNRLVDPTLSDYWEQCPNVPHICMKLITDGTPYKAHMQSTI